MMPTVNNAKDDQTTATTTSSNTMAQHSVTMMEASSHMTLTSLLSHAARGWANTTTTSSCLFSSIERSTENTTVDMAHVAAIIDGALMTLESDDLDSDINNDDWHCQQRCMKPPFAPATDEFNRIKQ